MRAGAWTVLSQYPDEERRIVGLNKHFLTECLKDDLITSHFIFMVSKFIFFLICKTTWMTT